jgi:hypothetical protein
VEKFTTAAAENVPRSMGKIRDRILEKTVGGGVHLEVSIFLPFANPYAVFSVSVLAVSLPVLPKL